MHMVMLMHKEAYISLLKENIFFPMVYKRKKNKTEQNKKTFVLHYACFSHVCEPDCLYSQVLDLQPMGQVQTTELCHLATQGSSQVQKVGSKECWQLMLPLFPLHQVSKLCWQMTCSHVLD